MKCEDCGTEMIFSENKVMIGKVWDKFVCPKCKNSFHKAISVVEKDK